MKFNYELSINSFYILVFVMLFLWNVFDFFINLAAAKYIYVAIDVIFLAGIHCIITASYKDLKHEIHRQRRCK